MKIRRTFVAATDKGLVRRNNEDAYIILTANDQQTFVLILADGMGGHQKGEVASSIAVHYAAETMEDWLTPERTDQEILDQMGEILERANVKVYLESVISTASKGMGTTLTMGVMIRGSLLIAHVGDCRVYLMRKQRLHQLTNDHTLSQALYEAGEVEAEALNSHSQRHVLTRALGVPDYMKADLLNVPVENGDRIIFCSDGLHGFVQNNEIREVMLRSRNPEVMVRSLINLANRRGGQDNVTVIGGFV